MPKITIEDTRQRPQPEAAGRGRLAVLVERLRNPDYSFTERQAGLWGAGVALYLVFAWLLVQRGLISLLSDNPSLNFYLVQPVIWLVLATLAYAGWRRLPQRLPFSRILTGIALVMGAFHVSLLVFGGVIFGFGDSYVAGQLANYPRNLWFVATWVLGLETARAFVLHAWRPFSERWAFIGTTALLALAMTPYGQLTGLTRADTFVSILGGFIVPTVVLSILLTWLAHYGGSGPAIAYRSVLLGFEWFSQVQPDLDWPVLFLIGTAGPVISAKFIRDIYLNTPEGAARWADIDHHEDDAIERRPLAWTVRTGFIALAVLGLAGLLGLRPAVVNGISMEPTFERGDLAIVQRGVDPLTLSGGDVIEFEDATGRLVVHRLIAIEEGPDGLVFTAQGDNNPRPDEPFTAAAIRGKVVLIIPALGWPAIWLRGE